MSVKVKICGIRTVVAARVAVEAGADFLGFNFVPSSKRFIEPARASEIINLIRGKAKIVGIFQDAEIKYVNQIAFSLGLDLVQLHGSESVEYCGRVGASVIKAFGLPSNFSVQKTYGTMVRYSVELYMVDREKRGEGGIIDSKKTEELSRKLPLFFSGGLTLGNVGKVIKAVRPYGVDVAGGIETDGAQDIYKMRLFIKNAKGVIV